METSERILELLLAINTTSISSEGASTNEEAEEVYAEKTAAVIALSILLKGVVANNDLCDTISNVGSLCELAAELLLGRSPSTEELMVVIFNVPSFRRQAWEQLTKLEPSTESLCEIIVELNELRDDGWSLLKSRQVPNEALVSLVEQLPPFPSGATIEAESRELLQQKINDIVRCERIRREAAETLLGQQPTRTELLAIYRHVEEHAAVAKERLTMDSSPETLLIVMAEFSELRAVAWDKLVQSEPSDEHLWQVFRGTTRVEQASWSGYRHNDEVISAIRETAARLLVERIIPLDWLAWLYRCSLTPEVWLVAAKKLIDAHTSDQLFDYGFSDRRSTAPSALVIARDTRQFGWKDWQKGKMSFDELLRLALVMREDVGGWNLDALLQGGTRDTPTPDTELYRFLWETVRQRGLPDFVLVSILLDHRGGWLPKEALIEFERRDLSFEQVEFLTFERWRNEQQNASVRGQLRKVYAELHGETTPGSGTSQQAVPKKRRGRRRKVKARPDSIDSSIV